MIVPTTEKKLRLDRVAVEANNFASLLVYQNWLTRTVIGTMVDPLSQEDKSDAHFHNNKEASLQTV